MTLQGAYDVIENGGQDGGHLGFYSKLEITKLNLTFFHDRHDEYDTILMYIVIFQSVARNTTPQASLLL